MAFSGGRVRLAVFADLAEAGPRSVLVIDTNEMLRFLFGVSRILRNALRNVNEVYLMSKRL